MWLLTDGTVLAVLRDGQTLTRLTPDAQGNYLNGAWSSAGSFILAKLYYASQILSNGKLVACGGEYTGAGFPSGSGTNFCEIYDPLTQNSLQLTSPAGPWTGYLIMDAPSTVLPNGTWIVGGTQGQGANEAVFDPQSLTWTFTTGDAQNDQGYALLQTGDVLTARMTSQLSSRYTVPSGFSTEPEQVPVVLASGGEIGAGVALMDGRVLWLGTNGSSAFYTPTSSGQNGSWAAGPNIPNGQVSNDTHAMLEPNGRVLLVASGNGLPTRFVEYITSSNPNLEHFSVVPGAPSGFSPNITTVMLVLPNGHGLISLASGQGVWYDIQFDAGGQSSWAPTMTSYPLALIRGTKAMVTGTQLCGLSEMTDGSDDGQNAENYPIVALDGFGDTRYLRSHDVSTRSIAPNQVASVTVDIPSDLSIASPGFSLRTIAMGISSNSVTLNSTENFLPAVFSPLLDD
jgi:hypothetical protein